jgi:hypothetical protein
MRVTICRKRNILTYLSLVEEKDSVRISNLIHVAVLTTRDEKL